MVRLTKDMFNPDSGLPSMDMSIFQLSFKLFELIDQDSRSNNFNLQLIMKEQTLDNFI